MSQQEMVPNSEDFQRLWLENPLSQEQLQKIILQRLLGELRSGHVERSSATEDHEKESSETLFTHPVVTRNSIRQHIRVYIGGLVIKLGQKIQGL